MRIFLLPKFVTYSQLLLIGDSINNHVQEDLSPCNCINIDVEKAASSSSRSGFELEQFVNDLLDKQDSMKPTQFKTLDEVLSCLSYKLSNEKERLRVQPEYALEFDRNLRSFIQYID